MKKTLAVSSLLAILCAPALADTKTLQLDFTLTSGAAPRHYAIYVTGKECGSVENKTRDQEDQIKVCVFPDADRQRLLLEWRTREGDHELTNHSVLVASRGQRFDVDTGTAKLTVALQ